MRYADIPPEVLFTSSLGHSYILVYDGRSPDGTTLLALETQDGACEGYDACEGITTHYCYPSPVLVAAVKAGFTCYRTGFALADDFEVTPQFLPGRPLPIKYAPIGQILVTEDGEKFFIRTAVTFQDTPLIVRLFRDQEEARWELANYLDTHPNLTVAVEAGFRYGWIDSDLRADPVCPWNPTSPPAPAVEEAPQVTPVPTEEERAETTQQEIAALRADLERERETTAKLTSRVEAEMAEVARLAVLAEQRLILHQQDIERIGERLQEECRNREWCDEYDEVIKSLNNDLNVKLPERAREYDVTLDVTVRVVVTAEATTEEMAYEEARKTFDNETSVFLRNGDIESVEDVSAEYAWRTA